MTAPTANLSKSEHMATLVAILESTREEIRSYRTILVSALGVSLAIPLTLLNIEKPEVFREVHLFGVPSGAFIIALWAIGTVLMIPPVANLVPNFWRGAQGGVSLAIKDAIELLGVGDLDNAFKSLIDATEEERRRVQELTKARMWLILAMPSFYLSIFLAVATYLWHT